MGKISWVPITQEEKPKDQEAKAMDPQFIAKSDKDMGFDNCTGKDYDLADYFGKAGKALKDNDE